MEHPAKIFWEEKWKSNGNAGGRELVSSFITTHNEFGVFGKLDVPCKFNNEFGIHMPRTIFIKCKNCVWRAKYKREIKKICGLKRFLIYYRVELFNLLQFDFYGDGIFIVAVFKEHGIESKYPTIHPASFLETEEGKNWRKDNFITNRSFIEYDKRAAQFSFNVLRNDYEYYEVNIIHSYLGDNMSYLRLSSNLAILFSTLEDGASVMFNIWNQTWKIQIKWVGGSCFLGNGWHAFAKATEIEYGDKLVLFTDSATDFNRMNVCIFKGYDMKYVEGGGSAKTISSFLKILTGETLQSESLVVPYTVKAKFGENLESVKRVDVGGVRCYIMYDVENGLMLNLGQMFQQLHLRKKDLIIFSLTEKRAISARVYQHDGMEISYHNRERDENVVPVVDCFWHVCCISSIENERETDLPKIEIPEKTDIPNISNFLAKIETGQHGRDIVKLPDRMVSNFGDVLPFKCVITIPSGRDIRVHYRAHMQSLTHIGKLKKECENGYGSMLLFKYEGAGQFMVHIFNERGIEIEYGGEHTHNFDIVSSRDIVFGVGLKFLAFADENTYYDGVVEIPHQIVKRFGKHIPPSIIYSLPHGNLVKGNFSKSDRKLCGLVEFIKHIDIEIDDVLLFTHWGVGKFDVIIFDKGGVEKIIRQDEVKNDSKDEAGYANYMEIDNMNKVQPDQELQVNQRNFVAKLKKSNVDKKSHGVYIPNNITPRDRSWEANEKITFRKGNGEWTIGIVTSNVLPRFSTGWNKFVKDNKLRYGQSLVFTLHDDKANGAVFNVV